MTTYLWLNISATGHINPTLAVVKGLVAAGDRVLYAAPENYRALIESTGAEMVAYPEMEKVQRAVTEAQRGRFGPQVRLLGEIGYELLPFLHDLVKTEQPDVVIHDMMANWGPLLCRLTGLPAIASVPTFVITDPRRQKLPLGAMLPELVRIFSLWPWHRRIRRRIRLKYRVESQPLSDLFMNLAPLNIVFTSREIQPGAALYGDDFVFVGASFYDRPDNPDFDERVLATDPLIYISLGTLNNNNRTFFKACLAAFADYDGHFVMAIGDQLDIAELGQIPSNFTVLTYVNQLKVLQHADVFFTHGGLNSVHEGLYFGVPLVVVPQQFEQAVNGRQIEKLGAAVMIGDHVPVGEVTPGELRSALTRMLGDESFTRKAETLGMSLRNAGGAKRAVDAIRQYAAQHSGQPDADNSQVTVAD